MKKYILVSNKEWQITAFKKALQQNEVEWYFIFNMADFTVEKIKEINPEKIFITHWSNKIPSSVYEGFNCILFHMTDLPYGRGGSPLQNLIVRGHTETKISAIKVVEELDAGDIYLKKDLKLAGTAKEIFENATNIMVQMILEIIETNPMPKAQTDDIVVFKRRKPEDSNIENLNELKQIYDYIRMLDSEGYPNAYIETEHLKFEFINADNSHANVINAHVRITKK
jgi:methionyl-tRNA formyltransferase